MVQNWERVLELTRKVRVVFGCTESHPVAGIGVKFHQLLQQLCVVGIEVSILQMEKLRLLCFGGLAQRYR